jgi:hypothetical protein
MEHLALFIAVLLYAATVYVCVCQCVCLHVHFAVKHALLVDPQTVTHLQVDQLLSLSSQNTNSTTSLLRWQWQTTSKQSTRTNSYRPRVYNSLYLQACIHISRQAAAADQISISCCATVQNQTLALDTSPQRHPRSSSSQAESH